MSGNDNVAVKPLVKHVLSKELQLYFDKVCSALLDEADEESRVAALASLRSDPGLHQLVPYFVQFISEKVTHTLKNLFVLTQMMQLTSAMLDNKYLYIDPYVRPTSTRPQLPGFFALTYKKKGRFPHSSNPDLPCRSPPWLLRPFYATSTPLPPQSRCRPPQRRLQKIRQVLTHPETPPRPHLP